MTENGKNPAELWREWTDPGGANFMGSGLNMTEYLQFSAMDYVRNSIPLLTSREEVDRRIGCIIQLSVAIQKISDQGHIFAMAFPRRALKDIIMGDWQGVKDAEGLLTFQGESSDLVDTYNPIFAEVRGILRDAYLGAPVEQGITPKFQVLPGGA